MKDVNISKKENDGSSYSHGLWKKRECRQINKTRRFWVFFPCNVRYHHICMNHKKASLYCLNHIKFYPLQLHELSFSQHISGWKQIHVVLQLLLHMSWLFVHKIEGNFLEILSPRLVEVLCNSFIIDISFRKQSKIALLNVCP